MLVLPLVEIVDVALYFLRSFVDRRFASEIFHFLLLFDFLTLLLHFFRFLRPLLWIDIESILTKILGNLFLDDFMALL